MARGGLDTTAQGAQTSRRSASVSETTIGEARSEDEKQDIYRLYYAIYVSEYGHPLKADHENGILRDCLDDKARHYGVKNAEGELIGAYRVNHFRELSNAHKLLDPLPIERLLQRFPIEALTYTSRLMVKKEWRGSTLIARMATQFVGDLLDNGVRLDTCFSLPHLVGLYEQLGYQRYGERIVDEKYGVGYPMAMAIQDKQHFLRVRSPLSRNKKIRDSIDQWEDGRWLASVTKEWGTNHRVMGKRQFWSAASHALIGTKGRKAIFKGLSTEKAHQILNTSPILEVKARDQLVFSGLHQENLYVIIKGGFVVRTRSKGQDVIEERIDVGGVFGVREFLNPGRSCIDAIAVEDSKVITLDQVFLRKARLNHQESIERIITNITGSA